MNENKLAIDELKQNINQLNGKVDRISQQLNIMINIIMTLYSETEDYSLEEADFLQNLQLLDRIKTSSTEKAGSENDTFSYF
ncbi:MAG: hypothetical protein ACXAC7_13585 [Candidatus Hodarchaeales archaeon]|jgi:uncharacterized coiled-coil DUF342 family protein